MALKDYQVAVSLDTLYKTNSKPVRSGIGEQKVLVYDPSLLKFENRSRKDRTQVIKGYHVDGVAQLYAVKENGYTLNPEGIIENIDIADIDAKLEGEKTHGIIGSEKNRYSRIWLGYNRYKILTHHHYHTQFNQLDNSWLGGRDNEVYAGCKLLIHPSKKTNFQSFNNVVLGLEQE